MSRGVAEAQEGFNGHVCWSLMGLVKYSSIFLFHEMFQQNVQQHFPIKLMLIEILVYGISLIQSVFNQHCGYWWPGVWAPGHQKPHCWVRTLACPFLWIKQWQVTCPTLSHCQCWLVLNRWGINTIKSKNLPHIIIHFNLSAKYRPFFFRLQSVSRGCTGITGTINVTSQERQGARNQSFVYS